VEPVLTCASTRSKDIVTLLREAELVDRMFDETGLK